MVSRWAGRTARPASPRKLLRRAGGPPGASRTTAIAARAADSVVPGGGCDTGYEPEHGAGDGAPGARAASPLSSAVPTARLIDVPNSPIATVFALDVTGSTTHGAAAQF